MNYRETLEYMYQQLPMFHRIGKAAYKANLNNANALDKLCMSPHRSYKSIHVAGTNGKGSVSHMLASVLMKAGYKTGLFTSPHLVDFRERIRINGEMIKEEAVVNFINNCRNDFEVLKPSFFEMTSALAFQYFKDQAVDVAVIETGLGGRLDSTNVINPVLSVITNIGYDHMDLLGDTLDKIAREKAGIIKSGVPVVIGEKKSETENVFRETAAANNSSIYFADQIYQVEKDEMLKPGLRKMILKKRNQDIEMVFEIDLLGIYQQKNIITVCSAIDCLKELGFDLPLETVKEGLKSVAKDTGLRGRWQVLSEHPLTICDTGHNPDGIINVTNQIRNLKYENLHFIFGVVSDKDVAQIIPLLPSEGRYYFTRADIPRAMDEKELKQKAEIAGLCGEAYGSVKNAIEAAKKNAEANDLIFIGGSTFVVADALKSGIFF